MKQHLLNQINLIKNSLLTKFVIILLIISVLPSFILMEMIAKEISTMEEVRMYENFSANLDIIALNIDNCLSSIESLHSSLLLDDTFLKNVNQLGPASSNPSFHDLQIARDLRSALAKTSAKNSDLLNIYMYWPDTGRLLISNQNTGSDYKEHDLSETDWFYHHEIQKTSPCWQITKMLHSDDPIFASYRDVMSVIISFNISSKNISSILKQTNPYKYADCLLIDSNGNAITTKETPLSQYIQDNIMEGNFSDTKKFQYNDESYYICIHHSPTTKLTSVLYANESDCIAATTGLNVIIKLYIFSMILLIGVSVTLVYTILIKPIKRLSDEMQQSGHGNLSVRLPGNKKNEIGQIYHRFNRMNASINQLIEDNYVSELRKKDFELKILSSQINEHFLYNTLDAIHWLARSSNIPEVGTAIHSLAVFYRISLSFGNDSITVEDLYNQLDSFLQIQKLLLGTLNYEIEIDPELYSYTVPKYLFVPLVDNAVHHGIRGVEDGIVCVSLVSEDSCLRFKVTDNGKGISPARLQQIENELKHPGSSSPDCFALKNLNAQLILYFNNDEGIQIETEEGCGSSFWFDIPVKNKELLYHDKNDYCG